MSRLASFFGRFLGGFRGFLGCFFGSFLGGLRRSRFSSRHGSSGQRLIGFLPQPEAAEKGVGVVARTATGGQINQVRHVAATQNHIAGFQGGRQLGNDIEDMLPPLLFAEPL